METPRPSFQDTLEDMLEQEKEQKERYAREIRQNSLKSEEVVPPFNKRIKKLAAKYNIPYPELRKRFMDALGIDGFSTDSKLCNEKIETAYLIMVGGHPIMNLLKQLKKENE